MATNRGTWRPDTCKCAVEIAIDTTAPVDPRGEPWAGVVIGFAPCAAHAGIRDGEVLRQSLISENVTRNLVIHEIAAALGWEREVRHPRAPSVVLIPEKNPQFAPETIPHSFNASRELVVFTADLEVDGADRAVLAQAIARVDATQTTKAPVKIDSAAVLFPDLPALKARVAV